MKFKNIINVSIFTLLSRILGLIRDILLAKFLGAGSLSDAFVVAFKIPNLFRKLFAEGSMQSGFIPIFSKELGLDKKKAKLFAEQIFTIMLFIVLIFIIVLEIFTPTLLIIISPGFKSRGIETYEMTIFLVRITLPYLLFISLSSLCSSILNSLGKFVISAFLPAFLNIAIILMLLSNGLINNVAIAGALGISLGGILQFFVVYIACKKCGWKLNLTSVKKLNSNVILFFKKIIPTILGAGVYQVNILVDIIAASFLPLGSLSYLYYADRIYQLPLAIIGIAIATVVLPFVSNSENNSQEEIQKAKDKSILFSLGFSIPATIGIIIFHSKIIETIFSRGEFSKEAVLATSSVLMIYSFSLPINILIKVILPFFYAQGDTKTPFISTVVCLLINLFLVFVLSYYLSYNGIALATVIASFVNFTILATILLKKLKFKITSFMLVETMKILSMSFVFMLILLCINFIIYKKEYFVIQNKTITLLLVVTIAISILILLTKVFKSFIYKDMFNLIKKK